ncbi:MAG: hypothetical protein CM1200mP30_10410 [Pseudomonadota bacterium]|nr:MAG: hypothetical protein CM1200mP30_10410 [Pseudomonadota bacterium]
MVIQSIQEELHSILTFYPTFELVNKMRFKISETREMLLNHHIPRFPRISLILSFRKLNMSLNGSV